MQLVQITKIKNLLASLLTTIRTSTFVVGLFQTCPELFKRFPIFSYSFDRYFLKGFGGIPISGRVDGASIIETVDYSGSIQVFELEKNRLFC